MTCDAGAESKVHKELSMVARRFIMRVLDIHRMDWDIALHVYVRVRSHVFDKRWLRDDEHWWWVTNGIGVASRHIRLSGSSRVLRVRLWHVLSEIVGVVW
jgi:hypothetical protein